MLGICRLRNDIQLYDWGSRTLLAQLLGRPTPSPEPEAELWLGAHPKAPSQAWVDGRWIALPDLLDEALPYLFKVLAVGRPLSIQTHPDRQQAIAGCRREDAAGLPRDAYERNYRDDQAKPEIIYAVTPFWMLRGFRPLADIVDLCRRFDIAEVLPAREDHESIFRVWMDLDLKLVKKVVRRARELAASQDDEARWVLKLNQSYPDDRGVLAPLLLNLHGLEPGETVYTGPGVLHAYLEGLGVELMTNSDNVVRCGLTAKHCDVPELLRLVRFEVDVPRVLTPDEEAEGVRRFAVPAAGLVLSVLDPTVGRTLVGDAGRGVEILLCTRGSVLIAADVGEPVTVEQGESVLVPVSAGNYRLEGSGQIFRAGVSR